MSDGAKFGLGALAAVLALVGLFVASRAVHGLWYYVGLGVFVVCVLAMFVLIRLSTRKMPEARAEPRPEPRTREAAEARRAGTPMTVPEPRTREAVADRRE